MPTRRLESTLRQSCAHGPGAISQVPGPAGQSMDASPGGQEGVVWIAVTYACNICTRKSHHYCILDVKLVLLGHQQGLHQFIQLHVQ